jgi:hypothetical protein
MHHGLEGSDIEIFFVEEILMCESPLPSECRREDFGRE